MKPDLRLPLGPPALLVCLLAAFMAWLVLGGGALLPWAPRWYVPVHTVLEVFSVVVTVLAFSTGWHGTGRQLPVRVALLAPVALAIGLFDVGHLLLARGLPGMPDAATDAGASLFSLLSRTLGTLALFAAALVPRERVVERQARTLALLAGLVATAAGYWLALDAPSLLRAVRVPGQGPTPFKIGWETVLIAINLVAALLLAARARDSRLRTDRYLAVAAAAMALGCCGFALCRQHDDVLFVSGHVYKLVAYLFLYGAVHVAAVQAPYLRLMRSERSLLESENKFRSLMECAPDAILLATPDGRIAMMNARAEELFGIARAQAAGMALEVLVPMGSMADGETECRRLHGAPFPAEVRHAATPAGQHIAIVRDVSERRGLERALLQQLTYDALTGLPNRRRILETLDEATLAARQDGRTLAVLVFDLNAFRKINSGYGWSGGDEVLRECVARLSQQLRIGDTLARQGGNEFIVVQKQSGREAALALGESLLGCMRDPFELGGQHVFLSASVGIALLPADATPLPSTELLQSAQLAMSGARADGPGRLRFHTAEMACAIRERVELETLLRHAIVRGQLTLQYQPRISLTEGAAATRMVGIEALVRWRHPTLGLVPPAYFIPLAEETGLIVELDMWVLREACSRAARWRADGLDPGRVSVNLSARQFQQAGLAQRVRSVLDDSGLDPAWLELEITESTVMRDTEEAAEVLRSLKALGVALSIDDFGTGYSSLSYLKRFPIDVLKIDRSFVKDVAEDPNGAAITRAIIALAHGLNLEAVAEGVETAAQAAFLRDNGCDEIQGYYFSPPVWPAQLETLMAEDYFSSQALLK
jgi:diguanylate cyclase (GGDEF)-like protein/PAS domain S-box-containing protein